MKKFLMTLIIVGLFWANNIFSQGSNDFKDKIYVGAKLGFNYSNVWDSEGEEFKADGKLGLVAGGFLSIPIVDRFSFQPEILFSQKGFKGTGRILGADYNITRTTNYFSIPLLAGFTPIEYVTILIGPQYSYLMKQTDEFENATTTIAQEKEFVNDNLRNNTFSFLFGADLILDQVVMSTRLGWDLLNNNGDGTSTTPRYKNTWWQLTIGYRFN
jgi:hypothetical protein